MEKLGDWAFEQIREYVFEEPPRHLQAKIVFTLGPRYWGFYPYDGSPPLHLEAITSDHWWNDYLADKFCREEMRRIDATLQVVMVGKEDDYTFSTWCYNHKIIGPPIYKSEKRYLRENIDDDYLHDNGYGDAERHFWPWVKTWCQEMNDIPTDHEWVEWDTVLRKWIAYYKLSNGMSIELNKFKKKRDAVRAVLEII